MARGRGRRSGRGVRREQRRGEGKEGRRTGTREAEEGRENDRHKQTKKKIDSCSYNSELRRWPLNI